MIIIFLLKKVDRPGWHSIRPRKLKVTAISALMKEVIKENANFSQLLSQGNYMGVDAQDRGIYSRNGTQQQVTDSTVSQSAFGENKDTESLAKDQPAFLESAVANEVVVSAPATHGPSSADCAIKHLERGAKSDLWKRAKKCYGSLARGKFSPRI